VRAWGFIGGPRRVPSDAEARAAWALVGAGDVGSTPPRARSTSRAAACASTSGGIAKGYAVDLAMRALRRAA
jgi:thiamine biosynthesis lipoprotein ApbE